MRRATGAGNVALVAAAALALPLVAGCTPKAAVLRPEHPVLHSASGQPPLLPTSAAASGLVFDDAVPDDDDDATAARRRIAQVAAQAVGRGPIVVGGARFRLDCSGVASGIYEKAGVDIAAPAGGYDVHTLFELVKKRAGSLRRARPLPGDFVFFDDTYDANENGLRDDALSHVGVVERVDGDGTVLLVHRVGGAVVRARMNLASPHDRRAESGRVLNHYLRLASASQPAKTTAELFVAYGSLSLSGRSLK